MQALVLTNTQHIYTVNILTVLQEIHTHTHTHKYYLYGHVKDGKIDSEVNVISKCDFTKSNRRFELKSYHKETIG